MRLALTAAVILAVSASGVAVAAAPRDPAGVAACLTSHNILTTRRTNHVVAPKSPQAALLTVSFALIPSAALNSGVLAFEKNAAVATRVGNEWLAYELARFKKGGLHVTASMVRTTYFVKDNVIAIWDSEPGTHTPGRAQARRLLEACI